MRFLDIDLDAFLDGVAHWSSGDERLDPSEYKIWSEAQVREFLEFQCGLSRSAPIPGRFITHHDEAFDWWADLIAKTGQKLEITHVDAHADLGLGDASWYHMHSQHLHLPMSQRGNPTRGNEALNLGSFLSYAVAAGWVSRLEYVYPDGEGNDLPVLLFKDCDPTTGFFELKALPLDVMNDLMNGRLDFNKVPTSRAVIVDPVVAFSMVEISKYRSNSPFDAGLLCQSPGYTPATADALISVIGEYITFA
jgi:hypothetical protein